MDHIGFSLWFIIPALITAFILSYDLNILSLGDETARSLGMKAGLIRFIFLTTAALLAGSVISFAGLLGFIGLIVPHAARFLIGHNNRLVVPFSALLGSVFTLFCDLLARVLFAPYEIPVGIIMSFLGGPFFIYLLFRQRRGEYMVSLQMFLPGIMDEIIKDASISFEKGITTIIREKRFGQDYSARTASGLLKALSGKVLLNGRNIKEHSSNEIARQISFLPQPASLGNFRI